MTAVLSALVTFGMVAFDTPERAAACSCAEFTDAEAYEFADVVFTGTLVTGSGPHAGDEDAERLGFDIGAVARVHAVSVLTTIAVTLLMMLAAQGVVDKTLTLGGLVLMGRDGHHCR